MLEEDQRFGMTCKWHRAGMWRSRELAGELGASVVDFWIKELMGK